MNISTNVDMETRWQDYLMVTVGIAFSASPFVIEYSQKVVSYNAFWTGLAIAVFALLAIFSPALWEEAVSLMLGCWSVASPWILRFEEDRSAAIVSVAAGGAVLLSALWAMKEEDALRSRLRENRAGREFTVTSD